jgi:hypothetical protein
MLLHSAGLSGARNVHRIILEKSKKCQHFLGIWVARWDPNGYSNIGKMGGCWVSDASIYDQADSRRIATHHFHSFSRKLF